MSNTKCRSCGKNIDDEGVKTRFISCSNCGMSTVVGNKLSVEQYRKLKGGDEKMAKKEKQEAQEAPKPEAHAVEEKKESITKIREENARKLREFIKGVLQITDPADQRKVLSNLYNTIAKEQKK